MTDQRAESPVQKEIDASDGPLGLVVVAPSADLAAGGAESKLYRLLRHLNNSRFEPCVAFLGSGSLERAASALGVRTYDIPPARVRNPGRISRATRALARVLRSERPDVVLGWNHKAQIVVAPAVRLARVDAKVTWIQTDLPDGLTDRLATWLPADGIICVSEWVAAAQARLRPRRPSFVIYPGIDSPSPAPPGEIAELRRSLAIPPGREVLGAVGRIEERKRQDLLIRAIERLVRRGRDVHGLIVGGEAWDRDAAYRQSLHALVGELDLRDRIAFTGYVDNPVPHLQLMDVYVHTCPVEAFGNALAEAMGAGVASVVVGTAGTAEVIEDGQSGLLVPEPDGTHVADAAGRLLRDPGLREKIAEAGRERQRTLFSASRMTHEFERRLTELARPGVAA